MLASNQGGYTFFFARFLHLLYNLSFQNPRKPIQSRSVSLSLPHVLYNLWNMLRSAHLILPRFILRLIIEATSISEAKRLVMSSSHHLRTTVVPNFTYILCCFQLIVEELESRTSLRRVDSYDDIILVCRESMFPMLYIHLELF